MQRKIINEGGRYILSGLSFLAIGSAVITVAAPIVATSAALAGSFYVFDKLKVTKKNK